MFSHVRMSTIAVFVILATLLALPAMAQQYTQLRYYKTTDYGASWSDLSQAGDLSAVYPTFAGLPDFDAVVNANNEIVYSVFLHASTNAGVYSVKGNNAPVLAIPEGANNFAIRRTTGWSTIGRTPNGDLYTLVLGLAETTGNTTMWVAKSTDDGTSWGAPYVVATEPAIPSDANFPQMSQANSDAWVFVVFQDSTLAERLLKIPTAGGTGTVVDLGQSTNNESSFYIGGNNPIAYDSVNNWLYITFRQATGATVLASNDQGATFSVQSATAASNRYPSISLNEAAERPYVFSNFGVPADSGDYHRAWYSYDEAGYGTAGLWLTEPIPYDSIVYTGNSETLLYVNQGYWWDANRGVSSMNLWISATPNGLYTDYTTDGGTTWGHFQRRYLDVDVPMGNTQNWGLAGGTDGVAYVFSSGRIAPPDVTPPIFSNVTLVTPSTSPGPWELTATMTDEGNDTNDVHLVYWALAVADSDTVRSDANFVETDPLTHSGTATFHIPANRPNGGAAWATGDTIWFYLYSGDLVGNQGWTMDMALVVGGDFLRINEPIAPTLVKSFALKGAYPNPFNPTTQIVFDLPGAAAVTLKVYNTMGQQVAVLADRQAFSQGRQRLTFDGANLPTGMYYYRLEAGPYSATAKMLLLK